MFRITITKPITVDAIGAKPLPSAIFSCPVCDGVIDQCHFCKGVGRVTSEKLATYEPMTSQI